MGICQRFEGGWGSTAQWRWSYLRYSLVASLLTSSGFAGSAFGAAILSPIGLDGFSGQETVIDFGTMQTFDPIDGQTIEGVQFSYQIGGVSSIDARIDGGPGMTDHISVANIEGDTMGVLALEFPLPTRRMGYGWAMLSSMGTASTTHARLFDMGGTLLGELSMTGAPDPVFNGGQFGVQSSVSFTRAEIFWSGDGPRFALDNLRFEAVPEPGSIGLMIVGLATLGLASRRRG